MQPDNEKITSIIDTASENLMRQVLPEMIAAGATPDQVGHAARAIGVFKQSITGEMAVGLAVGSVGVGSLSQLRSVPEIETLQNQLIELAEEYEEQAQLWEEEYERLSLENQMLKEQLQADLAPRNGHSPQAEEASEDISPREVARERIRGGRRRLGEKSGFGTARGRR